MNMMMDMLSEEPTNHTNEIQNFESLAHFFVNERNSVVNWQKAKVFWSTKYRCNGFQYSSRKKYEKKDHYLRLYCSWFNDQFDQHMNLFLLTAWKTNANQLIIWSIPLKMLMHTGCMTRNNWLVFCNLLNSETRQKANFWGMKSHNMCKFWGQIFQWFSCSVRLSLIWQFWHLLAVSICSNDGTSKVSVPNFDFSYASTNAHNFKKKFSTGLKSINLLLQK